jgi:flagellar hook assembly protein FlgD
LKWDGKVTVDVEKATFTFTVKNKSEQPIILEFPTSQLYDYSVYNAQGERVYHFGKGKMFLQALQFKTLNKGEQIQFNSMWNYKTNEAEKVPAGMYTVTAVLNIRSINDKLVQSKPSTTFDFFISENHLR